MIINNKQTNLIFNKWLWLRSGSGPSWKRSTPAPLLPIFKIR